MHETDIKSCFVQSPYENRSQRLATAISVCFFVSVHARYLREKLLLLSGVRRVNHCEYRFLAQEH